MVIQIPVKATLYLSRRRYLYLGDILYIFSEFQNAFNE